MVNKRPKPDPWYVAGLHFECTGCGDCCSGPGEGVIWVARTEITLIADFLKIDPAELRRLYLRREGMHTTIIEESKSKDCIFLASSPTGKKCKIYSVRPNQCRTWPFWACNLTSPDAWNTAAQDCPGMNRGKLYTCEEIDTLKKKKCWWKNEP